MNLLGNAIKFTESGHILIHVEPIEINNDDLTCKLIIKDTGIGIPKEELKHIFDRFYRVNPSYRGKYKGTGLGLAITKKLVENLDGVIQAQSHPGVGTKFICTLPVSIYHNKKNEDSSGNDYAINATRSGKKLSVLLVEDVPLIQRFSTEILETLGCKVTLARNAAEALEFANNPYDLIFMDIGLPDQDGLVVAREIRMRTTKLISTLRLSL